MGAASPAALDLPGQAWYPRAHHTQPWPRQVRNVTRHRAGKEEHNTMGRNVLIIVAVVLAVLVCGALTVVPSYNSLVPLDEQVQQSWGQVQTQYQRRADLVPNLVSTVQGAANFEKSTLVAVTEARAAATKPVINISGSPTPEQLQQFQASQDALSSALTHLLAVSEAYPTLTATQNFRDLQAQLEGTENRIAVARKDFNDATQNYNQARRRFPLVLIAGMLGFSEKPYFASTPGAEQPPKVDFGTPVPASQP
jgi:LemA protein